MGEPRGSLPESRQVEGLIAYGSLLRIAKQLNGAKRGQSLLIVAFLATRPDCRGGVPFGAECFTKGPERFAFSS